MFSFNLAQAVLAVKWDDQALQKGLDSVNRKVDQMAARFAHLGAAIGASMAVTSSAVAGVAQTVKAAVDAAVDLERQYITLARVTGLAADAAARLQRNLKGVAASKPGVSLQEVNRVALWAAYQGVGGEGEESKVQGLTKVASDLSDIKLVLDSMDIEEAATAMLRTLNVFGLGADQLRRFGSALVGLDNASTATASELLDMTNRMSGVSKVLGATIPQTMGLAAAMRDAGLGVETGATAIEKLASRMSSDPQKFVKALKLSGKEAADFAKTVRNDPIRALEIFLAKVNEAGAAAPALMKSLNMEGHRTGTQIIQFAQRVGRLREYIRRAEDEWSGMKSLDEGVERSAQGLYAKLSMVATKSQEVAANIGEALLPLGKAFADIANSVVGRTLESTNQSLKAWVAWGEQAGQAVRDWYGKTSAWFGRVAEAAAASARAGYDALARAAGSVDLASSWRAVKPWIEAALAAAVNFVATLDQKLNYAADVVNALAESWDLAIEVMSASVRAFAEVAGAAWEWLKGAFLSVTEYLANNWRALLMALGKSAIALMAAAIQATFLGVRTAWQAGTKFLADHWKAIMTGMVVVIKTALQAATAVFELFVRTVLRLLAELAKQALNPVTWNPGKLDDILGNFTAGIGDIGRNLRAELGAAFADLPPLNLPGLNLGGVGASLDELRRRLGAAGAEFGDRVAGAGKERERKRAAEEAEAFARSAGAEGVRAEAARQAMAAVASATGAGPGALAGLAGQSAAERGVGAQAQRSAVTAAAVGAGMALVPGMPGLAAALAAAGQSLPAGATPPKKDAAPADQADGKLGTTYGLAEFHKRLQEAVQGGGLPQKQLETQREHARTAREHVKISEQTLREIREWSRRHPQADPGVPRFT